MSWRRGWGWGKDCFWAVFPRDWDLTENFPPSCIPPPPSAFFLIMKFPYYQQRLHTSISSSLHTPALLQPFSLTFSSISAPGETLQYKVLSRYISCNHDLFLPRSSPPHPQKQTITVSTPPRRQKYQFYLGEYILYVMAAANVFGGEFLSE